MLLLFNWPVVFHSSVSGDLETESLIVSTDNDADEDEDDEHYSTSRPSSSRSTTRPNDCDHNSSVDDDEENLRIETLDDGEISTTLQVRNYSPNANMTCTYSCLPN